MNEDEKTNRWGAPLNDGQIHLQDHDFDYEDYFERHRAGKLEPGENEEFSARIYGMFCRDVFLSGGDISKVSFWAANYVAEKLHQALGGVKWEDLMGLPWDCPTPLFTKRGQRAFDIYAHVKNSLRGSPNKNITDLIREAADINHVSYESARAGYYAMRAAIDGKEGIPDEFLNLD